MGPCYNPPSKNRMSSNHQLHIADMYKIRRSICKINFKDIYETGFFMRVNNTKYLITKYYILNERLNEIVLEIKLYNDKKLPIRINNKNITFLKKFGITIIEIKESDNKINDIFFLDYDLNYIKGYNQVIFGVFSSYYNHDDIEILNGTILEILNTYEFKHNLNIHNNSIYPIILSNNLKVIGINKIGDRNLNQNIGFFIREIFTNNILNKNENEINLDNNYIISEIFISEENVGKKIRIINSYEESQKESNLNIKEEFTNEKEIKECQIEINDQKYPFSYFQEFKNLGNYKIKYSFPSLLKNCSFMFADCSFLTNLDLSNFNSRQVENMDHMFSKCSSLTNLNLSNFNTQNVTNMSCMFSNCSSLTKLNLSNFNTQNVTNMFGMFSKCSSLTKINLCSFDTKNVTDMDCMFDNCSSLTNLDLSHFNTQKVIDMGCMFSYCSSLTYLNLSNFNTQNVTDMYNMFNNCTSLTDLKISNFNTHNDTNIDSMFDNCSKLNSINTKDQRILEIFKNKANL